MQYTYDLHIHTAASPCADSLMTPHNIVNMSLLKGLQVIAITDHQTVCNCEAVMKVGEKKGLKVIPGIEIECREEFHLICLFKNIQYAKQMEEWLKKFIPYIPNNPHLFGKQEVINEKDEKIGEISYLLLVAAAISVDQVVMKARSLQAIIYPAHIDRKSYSILSNLGSIPEQLNFNILEISRFAVLEEFQKRYPQAIIIQSSDAHYLQDISESKRRIDIEQLIVDSV